jgi:hypothetical protein
MEFALPLDYINAAAAREKSIRHGHPSTLHLWWARRPLAVARAVPQSWKYAWMSWVPGRFGGCFRPIGFDVLGTLHFCHWLNPASKAAAGKFPIMADSCLRQAWRSPQRRGDLITEQESTISPIMQAQ